jgi:hypothetical protein
MSTAEEFINYNNVVHQQLPLKETGNCFFTPLSCTVVHLESIELVKVDSFQKADSGDELVLS